MSTESEGEQRSVSQKFKEENVRRRRKWSTEFNAATRQATQGLKHIQCMGDLQDFNGCRDNGSAARQRGVESGGEGGKGVQRLSIGNSFGFNEEVRERQQVKRKERASQLSVFKAKGRIQLVWRID